MYAYDITREEQIWEIYRSQLARYVLREGNCNVPKDHEEDGIPLGKWVERQRANRLKLKHEQRVALASIGGWHWDEDNRDNAKTDESHKIPKPRLISNSLPIDGGQIRAEDDKTQEEKTIWQSRYRLLVRFSNREGHCLVPKNHKEEGYKLGKWVAHQQRTKKSLPKKRREMLQMLNGWKWNASETEQMPSMGVQDKSQGLKGTELSEKDNGNLVQDIWAALFGRGQLTDKTAVRIGVKELYQAGMISEAGYSESSSIYKVFLQAFKEGIELGIMDRPEEGYIRAVRKKTEYYEDADWDLCIKSNTKKTPIEIEKVIERAAEWAKRMLGLEFEGLESSDDIHRNLSQAIGRAIENEELASVESGFVQQV